MSEITGINAPQTPTTATHQTTVQVEQAGGASSARNVRQATAHLFGASIVRNLGQLGVMILLARNLSGEDFGQYTLALAIVTPIFVFAQLNLRTVFLTILPPQPINSHLAAQHLAIITATIVAAIITLTTIPKIIYIVLIIAVVKAGDAYIDLLSAAWQSVKRTSRILWGSLLVGGVSFIAAIALMLLTGDIFPTLLALAISSIAAITTVFILPLSRLRRHSLSQQRVFAITTLSPKASLIKVLKSGLPLGAATAILSAVSFAPQYFLASYHGKAASAIFAVLIYMYALADLAMANIAQAWVPRGQSSYNGSKVIRWIMKPTLSWTAIFLPISVCLLLAGSKLYPLFFGTAYAFNFNVALPIAFAIAVLPFAHFTGAAINIENRYKTLFIINCAAATTAFAVCMLLISSRSIAGGFWALAAATFSRGIIVILLLTLRKCKKR